MKLLILGALGLSFVAHSAALVQKLKPTCSLSDGLSVACYSLREKPILRAGLLYYGAY